MKKFNLELSVGLFMIAGIICLGYLSVRLGKMEVLGEKGYEVKAIFSNSGGLKAGSSVVIAGVEVGRVRKIVLDDYQALVALTLPLDIKIQEDAIASIKTKGLIGEKYIGITPGGSEKIIEPGGRIRETQPAVDMEQLISSYVFGKL
jgi:phospholipid/cholesterol/gamma-HCH transport system substrate-binding protein